MRFLKGCASVAAMLLLVSSFAAANPGTAPEKAWSLTDLPQLAAQAGTQNESEPGNDTCPGDAYILGDTYIAEINVGGDEDWISFQCNAGDFITVGTDSGGAVEVGDTIVELYADDCVTFLTSDDDGGPGLYSLISNYAAPYTGTYHARVIGWSSSDTGGYVLIGDCVPPPMPGFCPIGQYKGVKINVDVDIPDNDPVGFETPPISFTPQVGCVVTGIVIDLDIEHTWMGDLIITLKKYDDQGGLIGSVDLLNRAGVPEVSTVGCSGDLIADPENKYYFGADPSLPAMGENEFCLDEIPAGCYAVAPENAGAMATFFGAPLDEGYWTLCVSDNAFLDTGYVHNWSVHLLCEAPVSVEQKAWGSIKAGYKK